MSGSRTPPELDRRAFVRRTLGAALAAAGASAAFAEENPPPAVDVPTALRRLNALAEQAPLSMQFRGGSADEARRWQAEFAERLRELLGPHRPPAQYESILERRVERPTHIREERVLVAEGVAAEGVAPVPFHLLLPKDAAGPLAGGTGSGGRRAGILAIHGHGPFGHDPVAGIDDTPERKADIDKAKYDYGQKLVERGYVVAAPCLTPFGRRLGDEQRKRTDPCTLVNLLMQHVGKLLIAENLRDCLWTLDALAAHAAVDPERLGCVGLSYGGRMTTFTTALDPRVKVCVIAGAMNVFQERAMSGSTSGCQVIPGLLNYGDIPEVASLIAPRPCLWTVGDKDGLLKPQWVDKFHGRLKRVYAAWGAADQLSVDRFAGGHEWHGEPSYAVLDRALLPRPGTPGRGPGSN
jgi:dienelactone hydrolase